MIHVRHLGLASLVAAALLTGCHSAQRAAAEGAEAQQLLDAGQIEPASQLIARAIRRRDDMASLYLVQAHVARAEHNPATTYQAYADALALDATNSEALMGVAQSGLQAGHLQEAERAADRILALSPQQPDALLAKGIIAVVRHDHDAAIDNADQILKVSPDDVGGLILKARGLVMRGDTDAALALMQAGVTRTGYRPDMVMSLIELYRSAGDGDAYVAMLRRLRALAPADIAYRLDLVEALYKRGQGDAARAELDGLLSPRLTQADALDQIVRLWNGYDPRGPTDAQLAATGATLSLEARMAVARHLIATGRPAAAIALLRPLATGWSTDIQGLMARAADAAGDPSAPRAADSLLAKDSKNGDALLVRARHLVLAGTPAAAIVVYQRVIGDYPQWDEGYLGLAAAYRALRKPAGAARALDQGVRARPQSYPLAAAYVRQLGQAGDASRMVAVARRFALDSPALPRAWDLYREACGTDAACAAEASAGKARSMTRFGLDPAPGTRPPVALIGRIG